MDIETQLEKDRNEITEITSDITFLRSEIDSTDKFSCHLINRLVIATENTLGCVILARASLAIPLVTVYRSIFESFISTYWASQDPSNASAILQEEEGEMLRILRNTLQSGRGKIVDKITGKIKTDTILNDQKMSNAKRRMQFSKMAEEANIKNIYDMFYPMLSMYAHGTATESISLNRFNEHAPSVFEFQNGAICCLKSIHLISINYIREKRKTNKDELESILKINLYN
jgi:Family of unknown function (DUF5677)